VYPDVLPDVEARSVKWYAYMYDSDQHQLVRADRSAEILQEAPEKEEKSVEPPKKEERGVETPENKEPEKKKNTITIKCGKDMWLKLQENGNTTIRKDVKVGEKDGGIL
jgi:hypothetical protein